MHDQLIDVVNDISYLGVTIESTGGWNRHKMKQMAKRNQSLVGTDKCLTRILDTRVQLLEIVLCVSRDLCMEQKYGDWMRGGRKFI
jgi:hypothetical protein